MDKKEEKEIDYLSAHINRLWTSLIVLIGGLIGLALSLSLHEPIAKFTLKCLFILLGACFLIITIISLINVDTKINKKIK